MTVNPRNLGPDSYRRIVGVAWVSMALIVLSGAAVRLTRAGLGCEDWPTCNGDRVVPEWELHGWIEFGNRLISITVSLACVVAVLAAYRLRDRRPDLVRWAWGLVAGVVAQILLGGVTVLLDLHPVVVSGHFLLSMVLLWNSAVLWVRASAAGPEAVPIVETGVVQHSRLVAAMATVVLLTGTVVTGTGPNSGDSRADRLPFELTTVTRIHSASVWLFLALLVVLTIRLHGSGPEGPRPLARALLLVVLAQGAVGYSQFGLGVPPLLVELHILGAVVVWSITVLLHLRLFERPTRSMEPAHRTATTKIPAVLPE